MAIAIQSIERRMRGGSQALLVKADSGATYIAKCLNNPQGNRTLINEWSVCRLYKLLQLSAPEVHLISLQRGIDGDQLMHFEIGSHRTPIADGIHLGSLCPVDPQRLSVFDFLPSRLLPSVINLREFAKAFVLDRWVGQADRRQAIFVRERNASGPAKFRCYFIDHGYAFGAARWRFEEMHLQGCYFDRAVYSPSTLEQDCQEAVGAIEQLSDNAVISAMNGFPAEWLNAGDHQELQKLGDVLCRRKRQVWSYVERALRELSPLLLGLLLLLAASVQKTPVTTVDILLVANRGPTCAQAPADTRLHLMAPVFDFSSTQVSAEVISENGDRIWKGEAHSRGSYVETIAPPIHQPGTYLVRLSSASPVDSMRECVLVVAAH